jgi:hypothetical protein
VSVAETQMHYLPCGAHKGREAAERERTDSFHRDGLARLVREGELGHDGLFVPEPATDALLASANPILFVSAELGRMSRKYGSSTRSLAGIPITSCESTISFPNRLLVPLTRPSSC